MTLGISPVTVVTTHNFAQKESDATPQPSNRIVYDDSVNIVYDDSVNVVYCVE